MPLTFSATVDKTGDCELPLCFADDYRTLTASLDWARSYAARGMDSECKAELAAAAAAARSLSDEADELARR